MQATGTDAERRRALAARIRGLYVLTPDEPDTGRLVASSAAALRGGARTLQYRNKTAPERLREDQARRLAACCRDAGALFIVNDDPDLAACVGADGVHVGEDDAGIERARAVVGPGALLGVSCYDDIARARAAVAAGADYVAFGSFFASSVKPGARHASLSLLAEARTLGVPVVAIGGITAASAPALFEAGADAVAVITAVFGAPDAAAAAARFAAPPARTRTT